MATPVTDGMTAGQVAAIINDQGLQADNNEARIEDLESVPPVEAPVLSVNSKIGAVVLSKADIGLSLADNTSDANKPISTAQNTALSLKADKVNGLLPVNQLPDIPEEKLPDTYYNGVQFERVLIDGLLTIQLKQSFIDSISGGTPALPKPSAPTAFVVDDTADTGNFTYTPGYMSNSDYEQTLDGGYTVTALSAKPIEVGNVAKAIGQVGVRVKAISGSRQASEWLFNAAAYTTASVGGSVAVTFPTISGSLINTSGDWSGGGTEQDFVNNGASGLSIPANQEGEIYFKGNSTLAAFGLSLTNSVSGRPDMVAGGFVNSMDQSKLYKVDAGTTGQLSEIRVSTNIYKIKRVVPSGVITYEKTTSNQADIDAGSATWTIVTTFTATSTARLYVICSLFGNGEGVGFLSQPRGKNIS